MKFLYNTYYEIAKKIKENNDSIVIYGAGMIGQVIMPYILEKYQLQKYVLYYIDIDKNKEKTFFSTSGIEYEIKNTDELKRLPSNTVLFITNSNFLNIVNMLDTIDELKETEGYIIPIIQILSRDGCDLQNIDNIGMKQLIPKTIHYCWFSKKPIPKYLSRCIDSWHRYCPDYEIIRWDENNYDVSKNTYMLQAYKEKKWGFVPDIARLDILYHHGGIYLDTDVEIIKNLDDLLYQSAFTSVEKWGNINMGGCSGAIPRHPIIKKMLQFRENELFIREDGSLNLNTCGFYETIPLIELGMEPNNQIQKVKDLTIYSSDFFHPYDYMSGETEITDRTFSIHHFNGGWLDKSSREERKNNRKLYFKMLDRMHVGGNV